MKIPSKTKIKSMKMKIRIHLTVKTTMEEQERIITIIIITKKIMKIITIIKIMVNLN